MANNPKIEAVITADDKASSVLKNFSNNADTMGQKINHVAKLAAVGVAAAAAGVVAFGVSSVKSYQESEDALAQLNATLASTKGVAGVTAEAATDLANSLQKVTKFSDEEVLSAENLLLTFTNIGKDIFPEATKAVLDMSTALGQDTKSSAIQLGKALQDPILGVTALRRVGVNFNEAQRDVIENLVRTGRAAEAQKLILKELQTEFGGSAEAAGKTFSGQLAILKNQMDEVKESIGLAIVNGLTPLMSKISEFVNTEQFQVWLKSVTEWLSINLPKAVDYIVTTLIPNLKNILDQVWPVISTIVEWLGKFIGFLAENEPALWAFIGVMATLKAAFFINDAVTAFQTSMAAIRSAYATTSSLLSTAIPISIVVGAALVAMQLIIEKGKETIAVLDQLGEAQRKQGESFDSAIKGLRELQRTGTPEQKARATKLLADPRLYSQKGHASGTAYSPGGMVTVGEQGPEQVMLPRGSRVVPHNSVRESNQPAIHITVQAGAYMGNQQDARRYAEMIANALRDVAKMKGTSAMEMLG